MRPFRFGVNCVTTLLGEWQAAARAAEALGYDMFIAQDHFGNQLAPLPALAAAAAVTSRLRLATLVLDNDFRHPALLAKEAATIDLLSRGRFELGLGAGWLEADYARTGLRLDPPAVRLERLREAVQICKALLSNPEPLTFHGKHYQLDGLDAQPRPVQHPRPPIMLGGRRRRMLSLAAREADIVGISLLDPRGPGVPPPPSFAQKIAWVREAAGARFSELELHVNASRVEVGDRSDESALASPGALCGSVEQIIDTLHARREQFGVSYYVIPRRAMEAFAPIVARLHGT